MDTNNGFMGAVTIATLAAGCIKIFVRYEAHRVISRFESKIETVAKAVEAEMLQEIAAMFPSLFSRLDILAAKMDVTGERLIEYSCFF